jgi:hypothetical protein
MIEQALHPPGFQVYLLNFLGQAYYLAGRLEEAIPPLKQYVSHYPDILSGHSNLSHDRHGWSWPCGQGVRSGIPTYYRATVRSLSAPRNP